MTPSYLTLEQQLELAKKVCRRIDDGAPDPQIGNHGLVVVFDCRNHEMGWFDFDPKLEGTAEQMADALRVIVAADEIAGASDIWSANLDDPEKSVFIRGILCSPAVVESDPLTSAALALLGDKT